MCKPSSRNQVACNKNDNTLTTLIDHVFVAMTNHNENRKKSAKSITTSSIYMLVKTSYDKRELTVCRNWSNNAGCVIIIKDGVRPWQLTSWLLSETQLLPPVSSCLGCHLTYASLCLQWWKKKGIFKKQKARKMKIMQTDQKRTEGKKIQTVWTGDNGWRCGKRKMRKKDKEGCN